MKKLLIVAVCAAGIISSQAQGLLNLTAVQKVTIAGSFAPAGTLADFLAGPDAGSLAPVVEGAVSPGSGSWVVGQTAIPGVPQGSTAFVQMQAYSGADTYASATTTPGAFHGQSTVQESGPLGGAITPGPVAPIDAFALDQTVIPEPSTIALAILGAAALFIRRRK